MKMNEDLKIIFQQIEEIRDRSLYPGRYKETRAVRGATKTKLWNRLIANISDYVMNESLGFP